MRIAKAHVVRIEVFPPLEGIELAGNIMDLQYVSMFLLPKLKSN